MPPSYFVQIVLCGCQRNFLRHQQIPPATGFCGNNTSSSTLYYGTIGGAQSMLSTAADSLAAADRLAEMQMAGCVDLYYRATLQAGQCLELAAIPSGENCDYQAAWRIYQQSIFRLIETGQQYGRLDPKGRLLIAEGNSWRVVPIAYHGFAWKPSDFCQLIPANEYSRHDLAINYQSPGLGVALIAVRHSACEEQFHHNVQPFAMTAILRTARATPQAPTNLDATTSAHEPDTVLEFFNPYLFDSVEIGSMVVKLNRDLTAPWAYAKKHA